METIHYIREHGLAALCERYAVKAVRDGVYPNLALLKYNQIESPMGERIAQECRGIVLDEADDWRVVCRAYDKFFNYGEEHAAAIDWGTARVYEKLDGSLCTLYHYRNEWRIATTGTPGGSGGISGTDLDFATLFRQTFQQLGYALPEAQYASICFIFELMTPLNRVIVFHQRPRIVLHGVRDLRTGREDEPELWAQKFGWECVRSFPLGCIDDCLEAAKALDPLQTEGYVVRDAQFRRVKIKTPQYVALAHLKEGMSGRRLLEIIRTNESEEFLSYFPEFQEPYARVRREYDRLCDELEAVYVQLKDIADQKAFAAEVLKTRCSSPLFAMRKGAVKTVREYFASCTFPSLERALGVDLSALVLGSGGEE